MSPLHLNLRALGLAVTAAMMLLGPACADEAAPSPTASILPGGGSSATATVVISRPADSTARTVMPALLGVNHPPLKDKDDLTWDIVELYKAIGITSVRTHDSVFDPCKVYLDDHVKINGVLLPDGAQYCNPAAGEGHDENDEVTWAAIDVDPEVVNRGSNYDWTEVDRHLEAINRSGAKVYLRLGESWGGPNRIAPPQFDAYADVAKQLAVHIQSASDVEFAEIWNEPNGRFWKGTTPEFYDLYARLTQRGAKRQGISAGGAGFTQAWPAATKSVSLQWATLADPDGQDFLSLHFYEECTADSVGSLVDWLDSVQVQLAEQDLELPLHITEWNLAQPDDEECPQFSTAHHGSYVAAALIVMALEQYHIERSHFFSGFFAPASSLFSVGAKGSDTIAIGAAAFGFWGYKAIAGTYRLPVRQTWSTGSGDAADAARDGQHWFAAAGETSGGRTIALLVNDDKTAMEVDLEVGWSPSNRATVRTIVPPGRSTVRTLPLGAARTVGSGDAAEIFEMKEAQVAWTTTPGGARLAVQLLAHSITIVSF